MDYTIHVIHRYREEFARLRNPEEAAVRTLAATGSALLGSALTTALGLGVLAASPLALLPDSQRRTTSTISTLGPSLSAIAAPCIQAPAMVVNLVPRVVNPPG